MKRLFITLMSFIALSTIFTSCKKEDIHINCDKIHCCNQTAQKGKLKGNVSKLSPNCPDCYDVVIANNPNSTESQITMLPNDSLLIWPYCSGNLFVTEVFVTKPSLYYDASLLVDKTTTDANGNYSFDLKPGEYSVFIKNEYGFYISPEKKPSGAPSIQKTTVKDGETSFVDFEFCPSYIVF